MFDHRSHIHLHSKQNTNITRVASGIFGLIEFTPHWPILFSPQAYTTPRSINKNVNKLLRKITLKG